MMKLGAVASTLHALLKFETQGGIAFVRGERFQTHVCGQVSRKRDHPEEESDTKGIERIIVNDAYPEQPLQIAANLSKMLKEMLHELLCHDKDIFACGPTDMTGIPFFGRIHPRTFPVWQKKRVIAKERSEAITTEVSKLVEARILKAVFFPKWVSNPVMVKKSDGTWRMCIDFTSLNKAYPKDSYPLPKIDQKIESLEGFRLKCFLDAYKGYHQVRMANQLGRNIEIYVSDMVIKSKNENNLISNIAETFDTLHKANMKLNPKKCTFVVETGKFLGYMITNEGIQTNPEKIQSIINMTSPRTLREVQSLNGKLAALGRFLAKSAERSLPFFKTLKGCLNKKDFQWSVEAEAAFLELKSHIQSLLALTIPRPGETLVLYLAAATEAGQKSTTLVLRR
ncbi:hypothetical protein Tco_0763453 [Tanacetum coccineum]